MAEADLGRSQWRKSTRSALGNECLEIADIGSAVGIRDSKNTANRLVVSTEAWRAFVNAVRHGDFDRR
jgi:hypothetical protein